MTTATADPLRQSVAWIYRGVWGVLTRWFRVPAEPPTLPAVGDHPPVSMRPANGFLTYQRVLFVAGWLWPVALTAGGVIVAGVALPIVGVFIAAPIAIVLGLLLSAGWVGLHLRFDTQWYVLTDRSVRIRRGVWTIEESTITFENVQDITILQGPLQRYLGIADVVVETAGGGGSTNSKGERTQSHAGHLQGVANAAEIKEMISVRVRASRSAGLGDEHAHATAPHDTAAHTALLREIVAELRASTARP